NAALCKARDPVAHRARLAKIDVQRVIPKTQLEVDPPPFTLLADVPEGREVGGTLPRIHVRDRDVVSGHVDQERVRETEIIVHDTQIVRVVVLHAESELEAVDPIDSELVEVRVPELGAAEPGQVENVAREGSQHASDGRPGAELLRDRKSVV